MAGGRRRLPSSGANRNRSVELERQPGLGRQFQVFLAASCNRRAGAAANRRANRRARPAAGDAANDRAKAGTTADLARGFLSFPLALRLDVPGRHLVHAAVEACCDADIEEARREFGSEWLVIKPPVSASAMGTHRLGPNDDLPNDSVRRPMIIQPLIEEIGRTGEFSLMLFGGEYSHAVVKRPKSGDFRVQEYHGGVTTACNAPPAGAIELAQRALAAAPAKATYARMDIVPDDEGTLRIMELELIEPSLFLDYAPNAPAAFTRAILSSVRTATA